MSSHTQPTPSTGGLPPVTPPSGKFIIQLFLVPGLIVCLIVSVLLLFNWLFSGARSPEAFLKKIDDTNPEVRWRAASDLAQVLLRDSQLSSNPDFALKLAERLDQGLTDNEVAEKAFVQRQAKLANENKPEEEKRREIEAERRKLEPERGYLQFLAGSLGQFVVPVGAPVLCRMAEDEPDMEPRALAVRRRQAVFALAVLADKLKLFDKMHSLEQSLLLDQLKKLADTSTGRPKQWVQAALECLEQRKEGKHVAMGVDKALIAASEAEDPVVREYAAFALGLWQGNAEENRRMEAALVRLANDNGRGADRIEEFSGPDPRTTSKEVLSRPGLIVQINAMLSLLRRGSDKVRPGMVQEMLDVNQLEQAIQAQRSDGTREPNRGKAVVTVEATLKALGEYYREKPKADLEGILARIEELTRDNNPAIATAAKETLAARNAGK